MKKQEEELSSPQRFWLLLECEFWIFNLFICAVALYILSQISFIDKVASNIYTTDDYKYSMEAIDLWERGYIIDIKVVNTDNCPQGYNSVIDYTWSGINVGCYCKAIIDNHNFEYLLSGDCSSQLISYGCNTINEISAQKLKMWRGGKLMCYKRAQSLSFFNSTLEKTPDGTTLKVCAAQQNYAVTTLPEINCPVSVIANSSLTTSQQILNLSTSQFLYYENQQNYPIADFKLTEYRFCPFFSEINISPNKNGNYILQIDNYSITCTGEDPRIVEFDYLNQEEFLTNNTRIYDLISALPGYPRPSPDYQYRLGYIRYPAWTDECRRSDTHQLLQAKRHLQFTHVGQQTKMLVYVGVPCLLVFAILFRGYYIIRHIFELKAKKQFNMLLMSDEQVVEQIPNLNLIKSTTKQAILLLIEILFLAGPLVVFIFCAILFLEESTWIKNTFLLSCTEEHLQGILYKYQELVDTQGFAVARSIVLFAVIIVIEIIHYSIRVFYGDLKGKETPVQQELSAQQLLRIDIDQKENIQLQDSSDIMIMHEKNDEKVYNLDNMMENDLKLNSADETNFNFYQLDQQQVPVTRKKKKKGIKRRNLFKEDN